MSWEIYNFIKSQCRVFLGNPFPYTSSSFLKAQDGQGLFWGLLCLHVDSDSSLIFWIVLNSLFDLLRPRPRLSNMPVPYVFLFRGMSVVNGRGQLFPVGIPFPYNSMSVVVSIVQYLSSIFLMKDLDLSNIITILEHNMV